MVKRLTILQEKFSIRIEEVKSKILSRSDSILSLIKRLRASISENSDKLDPEVISSVSKKLNEAESIVNGVSLSASSIEVSGSYSSIEDLRSDATSIKLEFQALIDKLKLAKNLLKESLEELKSSRVSSGEVKIGEKGSNQ